MKTVKVEYGGEIFKASGTIQKFDGWAKLYEDITENDEGDNKSLPAMAQGENIEVKGIEMLERETKPPRRYTEATLVKELDRRGIGRPSTYATILKGLKSRRYLIIEKGSLVPTNEGRSLVACLKEKHPWVIDYNLTKSMEEYLDKVQENRANWRDFAKSLHKQIGFAEPPAWEVSKTKIGGKGNGKRTS
jgi:DNA topoisomerase-1